MVPLRNRFMQCRVASINVIALKHGDSIKVIGEHPCGHQSCQAPSDDHRVSAKAMLHNTPPIIRASPQRTQGCCDNCDPCTDSNANIGYNAVIAENISVSEPAGTENTATQWCESDNLARGGAQAHPNTVSIPRR